MLGYVGDASSIGKHILSDKMSNIFQHVLPVQICRSLWPERKTPILVPASSWFQTSPG